MRLEITIPDQLYRRAKNAASAKGLTVEGYMAKALQVQLRDENSDSEPLRLSAEQAEFIRRGREEVRAGNFLTAEQVKAELAANKAAWREANQK